MVEKPFVEINLSVNDAAAEFQKGPTPAKYTQLCEPGIRDTQIRRSFDCVDRCSL